ncbi:MULTISPECIES: SipW-dependent-type signal peptide-containing protein [Haloferacaceae]|uniref:SipW-dependent-type signal peptide-containing protein n=2 Tax=Halorubrum glutamatedens TaxID=2707018 RepID=A0ABD5QVE1_9EURY|nr:SipW-dependent-type signal peptide-containing protein [Halobellus captivus]
MERNDGFQLSRRKALAALGGVGVASAGAGLGTSAYFSDEESFENNSLSAGELDLKVDWQQTYNGPIPNGDGEVGEHPVNAYPDTAVDGQSYGDGLQDLDGVRYSGAGELDPVFDAADVPACCDCAEDEYYVTYGGESYCVSAISGDESTDEFYDYDTGEWSSLNDDIQRRNTTVLFLYEDDEGDIHLFIINNELDNTRSSDNGFVASVTVEGAEGSQWLNAAWIDQDEPGTDIDAYQDANGSNVATADWAWQNRKTDGGVLGTLDEDFALRVTPALNNAATYDGNSVFQDQTDIERLVLLDGDTSTEVVLEDTVGTDGDLDPIVIHSSCGIDSGAELDTPAVFRSQNYPDQEHLVELDDVKPGDTGEITFSLHLCDNPGYVWFMAGNFSQDGGTLTEPERVAMNESDPGSVTESDDTGTLADYVDVTLWYDDDCDNTYDEEMETPIFEGTLAGLMDELGVAEGADEESDDFSGMLGLDADPNDGDDVECFPAQEGFCIGFEWEVSTEVGNVIQGDSVGFDLGFYTEQCRHNDGSGPDGNGTN